MRSIPRLSSLACKWPRLAATSRGCPSVHATLVSLWVSKFPLIKNTSQIGFGPTLSTLFLLNRLFQSRCLQIQSHPVILEIRVSINEFWERTI